MKTFYEDVYIQKLNNFNTALAGSAMPASGSYIEAGQFERVAFLVELGTLTSDLVFTVGQATGASATAKDVAGASIALGNASDNQWGVIEVETARLDLANGYHYVLITDSGAAGSDDYACVTFFGLNPRRAPVTQPANLINHALVVG
jgi:hypothetical protein